MRRKRKTTRRVRIKLDFMVEVNLDIDSPPFGCTEAAGAALTGVLRGLKDKGVVAVYSPNLMHVALDYRKINVVEPPRPPENVTEETEGGGILDRTAVAAYLARAGEIMTEKNQ